MHIPVAGLVCFGIATLALLLALYFGLFPSSASRGGSLIGDLSIVETFWKTTLSAGIAAIFFGIGLIISFPKYRGILLITLGVIGALFLVGIVLNLFTGP